MGKNRQSWISIELYEKVSEDINNWPDWKKRAYNEMFTGSAHAEKLQIREIER